MAVIKNVLISVLAVMVITACAYRWDVKGVRNMESKGTVFDTALKGEFTEFADLESQRGDWNETERYLIRARAAADGVLVEPYSPYLRRIPLQVVEDVHLAHELLVQTLNNARVAMPEVAAEAQMGYECWLEALEENLFVERMEACRNQFETAMNVIYGEPAALIPNDNVESQESLTVDKNKSADPYIDHLKSLYIIYFAFNKANIETKFQNVITQAGAAYQQNKPERVQISGHADTVGSEKINIIVSQRRADSVVEALVKAGIPKDKMEIKAFGETQLAVPTSDNIREPRNRRVEIELLAANAEEK